MLSRTRTSLIAVDFGACSFRAAQLVGKAGAWRIHHWVNIESEPAASDAPAMSYLGQMSAVFGPATFTGDQTALLLSPPDVEFRLLELPTVLVQKPPGELRTALQFELDRQMPWPAAEAEIAAWTLKPEATGKATTLVAAARTATVEQQLGILADRELECQVADIMPNAMIPVCWPPAADKDAGGNDNADAAGTIWGVLDIGFRSARLYLLHARRPVYARVLRGSGRELTEALAEALHIDFRIAEQYKRIYGIRKSDRGFRSLTGGLTRISEEQLPTVLYAILRPTIEEMAKDIDRSCQYVLGQLSGVSAGPIYLVGGGARLRGLVEALSGLLGVPVLLPEVKRMLPAMASQAQGGEHPACTATNFPALAPCVGLAMGQEGGS